MTNIEQAAPIKADDICLHCYTAERTDGTVYCPTCIAMYQREYGLAQEHGLHERIQGMDFVAAMVALGYIEDGSVIDAFWRGLLSEQEVAHIEEDMHWHLDTAKVRTVLAAKQVAI